MQKHRQLAVFLFRGNTFLQTKKNPPKRVFPKTIIDSLSAAILAYGRSSMILKHSLCFS